MVFGDESVVGDDEMGLFAEGKLLKEPENGHCFREFVFFAVPLYFHGYLLSTSSGSVSKNPVFNDDGPERIGLTAQSRKTF